MCSITTTIGIHVLDHLNIFYSNMYKIPTGARIYLFYKFVFLNELIYFIDVCILYEDLDETL